MRVSFFFLLRNYTYLLVTCFTLDNEKKIVSTQTAALDDGDYESLLKNHKGISTYYITYFLITHSCPGPAQELFPPAPKDFKKDSSSEPLFTIPIR